jgi:hypothetical protein
MSFLSKLFGTVAAKKTRTEPSSESGGPITETAQIIDRMKTTLAEIDGMTQAFVIDIEEINNEEEDDDWSFADDNGDDKK